MFRILTKLPSGIDRLDQWTYSVHFFAPDEIAVWNSNVSRSMPRPFRNQPIYNNLSEITDSELILLQPSDGNYVTGDIPIQDFIHPQNATYIFGEDDGNVQESELLDVTVTKVCIPKQDPVAFDLFSSQAMVIACYDRMIKLG